ncbi:MAG: adenylate/guanylate cyclase domain-containing protein [Proteobacteria bacterium]|nr:adenylate/guanylate cyclase domain-containing protein [Pseudomonadota bacterium]
MIAMIRTALRNRDRERSAPQRVQHAIEVQRHQSEKLIGWFQLAVVVTFATLYALSPKTFSDDAAFEPVPWALAGYLGFTVLRMVSASRGPLPRWLVGLSVVMDMALLFGLIWSFHLQYQQPAAFYLKAPTILYVFIFIALRALRFEARFVLLAGVTAALGWLVLVLYAILSDASNDMITRDYVEYMTSAQVLLGAEFDKMISILLVTVILAVAIIRARELLFRAIGESMAARDLSRFFTPEIAAQITSSQERIEPGQGEIREAAILQCDIRGFTLLAKRLPPAAAIQLLVEYEKRLVPVIQKHGGSIDKFMGDGIMATFGAVVPSTTYAADALRAVDDLQRCAAAWAEERRSTGQDSLTINFSVAHGSVIFGAVGDETRLEYTVIGDAVNLSAKLEKHNKETKTTALTTTACLEAARAQGFDPGREIGHLPSTAILGVADHIDLAVLVP